MSTNKLEAIKAKRKELANLSRGIKPLVAEGVYDSVNEGLLDNYSDGSEITFHTFNGWKEEGFAVKKGSKAFLIWGKPRKVQITVPQEGEDEEFKYWPLCFLFSENQVERRQTK